MTTDSRMTDSPVVASRWLDGYGLGPYSITVNHPQTHIRVRYSNNGVRVIVVEAAIPGPGQQARR